MSLAIIISSKNEMMLQALLWLHLLSLLALCANGYVPHGRRISNHGIKNNSSSITSGGNSNNIRTSRTSTRNNLIPITSFQCTDLGMWNRLGSSSSSSSSNPLRIRGGDLGYSSSSSTATTSSSTQLSLLLNPSIASLLSGSIAGAIGVGVAFPLDTLKTKSQVLGRSVTNTNTNTKQQQQQQQHKFDVGGTGGSAAFVAAISSSGSNDASGASKQLNMVQLISLIYRTEGMAGFFGGVKGMMVGQAIIKSVAFSANASALVFLNEHLVLPSALSLLLAACFSGFVTSFLVTPIERIKVLMQASNTYKNEIECLRAIIKNDEKGVLGVLGKGLGPTLAREVPSYGIYFLIYGLLMKLPIATELGAAAPLVFGALTGMASWIPVYPVDVVKTLVQSSDGLEDIRALDVAVKLYQERGIGAFFDGLTPKMLRAAVNHSVTFFMYDMLYQFLTSPV